MNKFVGILDRFSKKKADGASDTIETESVEFDPEVSAIYNSILSEYSETVVTESVSDFELNIDLDVELDDVDPDVDFDM
jgi:hypothetical protein